MSAGREPFGQMPDGTAVERITLRGEGGFAVAIITYGAAIQAIHAPDAEGRLADVVLGHDDLRGYVETRSFFGATIGRYANRIAAGRFGLDGKAFRVEPNNGPNALHGGAGGFDTRVWQVAEASAEALTLKRTSADGEEGFPGTLDVTVRFRVHGTALSLAFEATTDTPTVVNLTNHSFFNLSGHGSILDHEVCLDAEAFLPVDETSIPLGEPASVESTPFDFRRPRPVGAHVRDCDPQLLGASGFDHNWCLRGGRQAGPRPVATVFDPASGRSLAVSTTEPGIQFYSGNFLDGSVAGKNNRAPRQSEGLCLEPQAYPDSPNRPDYPSVRLEPGQTYRHLIEYRFGTGRPASPSTQHKDSQT